MMRHLSPVKIAAMYHFFVRRKLRLAFADINEGRYAGIVDAFAEPLVHVMHGHHALAGERRTLAAIDQWYARLQRLLPDLHFRIHAVISSGWPWATRATVSWTDEFTLPDGTRGTNQGVHEFLLRWGKVRALAVHCDTARLEGYCQYMAATGRIEALASPITDGTVA